jgi:hypothetical protein
MDELYKDCVYLFEPRILYDQQMCDNFNRVLNFIPNFLVRHEPKYMTMLSFKNRLFPLVEQRLLEFKKIFTPTAENFAHPRRIFITGDSDDYDVLQTILFFPWCKRSTEDLVHYKNYLKRWLGKMDVLVLEHPVYKKLL